MLTLVRIKTLRKNANSYLSIYFENGNSDI